MSEELNAGPQCGRDVPVPAKVGSVWGSDAVAAMLRQLDIPYLALNPGASFRGLHDSLVNYNGNASPQMLLCLHEESAVSIAQGYAKAAEKMMGCVLHSNVGLMHASMSIFNAWCDRVPMLILGASGPWDAAKRRPWIDWIHTCSDQGALVRDYTKWDNQPASVPATTEALLRAVQIADTAPRGPTYVNLDCAIQETRLDAMPELPDVSRFRAPPPSLPAERELDDAVRLLEGAKRPVILMGRGSRSEAVWQSRVKLAEALHAVVMTDLKMPAVFPTDHPLHPFAPATFFSAAGREYLRSADVILALDWYDLGGALKQVWGDAQSPARIINVSPDQMVHRGWSMDYQGLPPMDVYMMCEPDPVVDLLLARVKPQPPRELPERTRLPDSDPSVVCIRTLAETLQKAAANDKLCITGLPLGWHGAYAHFRHPLDYMGSTGGGGIGAGPGITIGAALALKDSGRLCVGIHGDGDLLMGITSLWTAAHYKIPCLMLIANNTSFYNDEMHQEFVARERDRPVENKWIGQKINEPDVDLAMMARGQGAIGIGPVKTIEELGPAIEQGLEHVRQGKVCVVDIRVRPGYDTDISGGPPSQKR